MTAGRPREFRNNADKQSAYRERKKEAEKADLVVTAVMQHLQGQERVLRNLVSYWEKKGKRAEICGRMDYGVVLVDGYNQRTILSTDWVYLLVSGALVEKRKRAFETVYELRGQS